MRDTPTKETMSLSATCEESLREQITSDGSSVGETLLGENTNGNRKQPSRWNTIMPAKGHRMIWHAILHSRVLSRR